MYQGFEKADLSCKADVVKAMGHICNLYWHTVYGILKKDPKLERPKVPYYHSDILHEVFLRIQRDLRRPNLDQLNLDQPNEYKQAGYLAFWVRKLKPFRHYPIFGGTYTNEFLGLHFGLSTVSVIRPQIVKKVIRNQRLWDEWLYDLRYRPVSGHELVKEFEMLAL